MAKLLALEKVEQFDGMGTCYPPGVSLQVCGEAINLNELCNKTVTQSRYHALVSTVGAGHQCL